MKNFIYSIAFVLLCSVPVGMLAQPANDNCSSATPVSLSTPTACATGSTSGFNQGTTTTLTGQTNTAATSSAPYPYLTPCGININNTPRDVWYSFVATGYQATITVSGATGTLTNPTITMWSGSCANLQGYGCSTGSGGAATLTVYQTIIGQTYYVQVAGADSTQFGTFSIGIACANNCAGCVLQSYVTASPLPVNGTFVPGSTVTFCYTVTDWDEGNANWLHGVTVNFGTGWDPTSLVTVSPPSCTSPGTGPYWAYYPAGQTSSFTGNYFGAGFYYETTAGSTSGVLDSDPGNNFGDVSAGQGTCSPTFCVTLTAYATDTPGSNLNVSFASSGDGESGSWSSPACAVDPTVTFFANSSCAPPLLSSLMAACNQSNGTDTARPIGNYAPYVYTWSNGVVDSTSGISVITNLAPGVYTVTVKNDLNCIVTARDTVFSASRPYGGPDLYLSCPSVVDSVVMSAVGQGIWSALSTNPAPVVIQNPDTSNTTISGFTTVGTYNFVWAIGACTDTVAVIVSSRPNAGPDVFTCVNGTATMAAIGTGTWTPMAGNPAPTVIANPTSRVTTISGFTVGGTYSYIWSVNTCTDTASVIVPNFVTSATGDTSLCKYLTSTLSATAGPASLAPFAYHWLDSTLVVSPNSATTLIKPLLNTNAFIVRVTSASGCILYDTVHVTLSGVAPRISIQPSNNNVCPGDTITLNPTILVANLVSCGLIDTCPDNTILSSQAVGTGGSATDVTTSYPGEYPAAKVQYLITAGEMNAAGLSSGAITDISFFVTQLNSTLGYDSFTISMGCTNLDSLTGFVNTLQEVAPAVQVFPNLGWTPHPFTHYYDWDGVSNIVIQICYTRTGNSFNNSDYVTYTTTPYSGSVAYAEAFSNNVSGCSLTSAALSSDRPNIQFGMCSPNTLHYSWSPSTLLCDTCPVTQVVVNSDTTYTLVVNDGGCINDSTVRVTINPYVNLVATPDTSLCNHDNAQLNVSMVTPAPSLCLQNYNVTSTPYATVAGAAITVASASYKDQFGNTDDNDGTAGPFNVGFSAPFYCESFTQFWVNANGWISFVNPYPATTGAALNTAQTFPPAGGDLNPQKEIAFVVGDYALTGNVFGGGHVAYFTTGTTPNRTLVVKFVGIQEYFGSSTNTSTGEIHVHETSGIVEIMINSSNYTFDSHTTGIKDTTGIGVAAPGRNNTPYTVTTPEGWKFTPQNGPNSVIQSVVWSPNTALSNDSIRNPIASPTVTTNYISNTNVLINQFTSPEVCHVRDTVTIKVGSFPAYTVTATPATICTGTQAQLSFNTADSVVSYSWTPAILLSDSAIRDPLATVYDTTRFYIVAGDTSGCHVRDSVTVYTYPHPHPSIGNDTTVCYNSSITLSLAGSAGTYQWFTVDPATGALTQIASTPTITGVPSHYYTLKLLDSASSCYYFTDTVHVDSFAHPLLGITASGPLAFCAGGNVSLQGDAGYTNYIWTPSGATTQAVSVSTSGDYSYTALDIHGCPRVGDIDSVVVSTQPSIKYDQFKPSICSGNADSIIISTVPPGIPVQWLLGGTQVATGDTFVATVAGSYDVIASQGCPTDSSFTLIVATNPQAQFVPSVINACACGISVPVGAVVTPPSSSDIYVWSSGTRDSILNIQTSGSYTVTVTDINQCTATATITATLTCPQVSTGALPDTIFESDSTTLTATPGSSSSVLTSYVWTVNDSIGTVFTPNNATTLASSTHLGLDTFYVTVVDNNNCTNTVPVTITVIQRGGLSMPTAFTPNGDGMNDKFYPIVAAGSTVSAFRIYNRWGQLLYDNPKVGPNIDGWNGSFGDKAQATDTYMYFITIESPDPKDASKKITKSSEGNFQLFR